MSKETKVAVIIPCYNEAQTIGKVVTDFKRVLPEAEIYVYDNNSKDGTDKIAREAGAIVRYEYRQGKGNVIRSMFRDMDADCVIMVDGDDTYPAEHAPDMVKLVLEKGVDMVIGDRLSATYFTENKRPFHNFGNSLVRALINFIFKSNIKDVMTGYRAFGRRFIKNFPVLSKGFEIETEMTIFSLDRGFLLEEIPVEYRDRPAGSESKLNTFSDGMKVLKTIANMFRNYKPLLFFSICGAIVALVATCLFIPILVEYFAVGIVPKFPTLIVVCAMYMISVLLGICGLILDTIVSKHRQLGEILMNYFEEEDRYRRN